MTELHPNHSRSALSVVKQGVGSGIDTCSDSDSDMGSV